MSDGTFVLGKLLNQPTPEHPGAMHEAKIVFEVAIPAKTHRVLSHRPQVLFRADGVVVDDAVAAFFCLREVRVNEVDQRWQREPETQEVPAIPALMFTEAALASGVKWDTCLPTAPMDLGVENTTDESQVFKAEIRGRAVL